MELYKRIINDKILRHLIGASVVYVLISIIIAFITLRFLNLMLGWNIVLAFIPVVLAFTFDLKRKEENTSTLQKIKLISIFLVWLFFFPNSFYVITDFIHLGGESFYYQIGMYAGYNYTENFIGYLTLLHIFLGAFIAVFMASFSLDIMHQYFIDKYDRLLASIIVAGILILSSIGIYIGRFLRLQSWDMIRPISVIKELLENISFFTFEFIIMFTLIQVLLYTFIRPFLKK